MSELSAPADRVCRFRTKSSGHGIDLYLPWVMQRSFSYQAPVTWKQFPVSVRRSTFVSSFRSFLKTFVFKNNNNFSSVPLP